MNYFIREFFDNYYPFDKTGEQIIPFSKVESVTFFFENKTIELVTLTNDELYIYNCKQNKISTEEQYKNYLKWLESKK